ncbi:hypothetical protein PLIIFM63780_009215 [Purpureocillium lilacinum]|nr:hypothetical protein PLIIFM63780_009215 [Purpureocillium lilacinum]
MLPLALIAVILLIPSVEASPFFAATPQRFNFFPLQSAKTFDPIRNASCRGSYDKYLAARARSDYRDANHWLFTHENCLLDNMTELKKTEMASAAILLGLTPVLLSSMGPSLAEVGLVALHRPLLAGLLALACPAVYPSRVMAYADDDARRVLRDRIPAAGSVAGRMRAWKFVVGVGELLVAAAAAGSTLYTSYELGLRTIFNQDGPVYFMPLILSLFPLLMHTAASSTFIVQRHLLRRKAKQQRRGVALDLSIVDSTSGGDKQLRSASWWAKLASWTEREFQPTHFHGAVDEAVLRPKLATISVHWVCRVFAILHVLYGVLVFSSLLFILTADAGVVVVRYLVSALVSKLLLAFQLGGMRLAESEDADGIFHGADDEIERYGRAGERSTLRMSESLAMGSVRRETMPRASGVGVDTPESISLGKRPRVTM